MFLLPQYRIGVPGCAQDLVQYRSQSWDRSVNAFTVLQHSAKASGRSDVGFVDTDCDSIGHL